jgi:hypothetical protein
MSNGAAAVGLFTRTTKVLCRSASMTPHVLNSVFTPSVYRMALLQERLERRDRRGLSRAPTRPLP